MTCLARFRSTKRINWFLFHSKIGLVGLILKTVKASITVTSLQIFLVKSKLICFNFRPHLWQRVLNPIAAIDF